jgi:ribonuclease-3
LDQCLTLSSASDRNNERLEFLGDAIVEMCTSEGIYRYTDANEGGMTKIRQAFVSNAALYRAVRRMGLDKYLVYTGTKQNIGMKPIASLFEAVTAGIYLEGGLEAARVFVTEKLLFYEAMPFLKKNIPIDANNYKGILQEYLQSKGHSRAEYITLGKKGPDHCPTFEVEVRAEGLSAVGVGDSKPKAQQLAAMKLLEQLKAGSVAVTDG